MKAAKSGAILNIASTGGVSPRPNLAWYNASKGWMIAATRAMAIELARYNVRVNAINPVAGDTPMLPTFMGGDTDEARGPRFARGTGWFAFFPFGNGLDTGPGASHRRSGQDLVALGQTLAHQTAVAVPLRLVLGVLDGFAKRGGRRVAPARGGKFLRAGLHGQFDDVDMPLLAEDDAGARCPAQNAADPFQAFLGLSAQDVGDLSLSGGHCNIHVRLRFRSSSRHCFPAFVVDSICRTSY